jgi:hypothetical protein
MSSTSAAAAAMFPASGSGETARKPVASLVASSGVAYGQPIDDLPPLVEPTGFIEVPAPVPEGRRPPRRSFLAPVARPAEIERPAPPAPFEIPPLIEPVAALRATALSHVATLSARWLKAAEAALPARNWQRLAIAAGATIGLLAGFTYIAGVGPFSASQQFRDGQPLRDPAQRVAYYQAGAKAGDADAQLRLAILYAKGEGVTQNYATAATWFRAAANQGSARAQYDLGVLYERGRGVAVDLTEAAKWYRKAAEAKHPLAQYNLAVCYTKGQGVREDLPEAALWYRRAAVQGVVQVMINLGAMYEKGEGVAASPVDAYAWYFAAGRRDSPPAARRAEELYASLPRLDQIRAAALASDVTASIHDSAPQDPTSQNPTSGRGEPR